MLELFNQKTYQKTLQSFVVDSRVNLSQSLGREIKMTHEEHYFLKSYGFSDISEKLGSLYPIYFSKMLKVYLVTMTDIHLQQFFDFSPNLIIPLNHRYLILGSFSPKTVKGYSYVGSLKTVLEKNVEEKYFLSEKMVTHLMEKARSIPNVVPL